MNPNIWGPGAWLFLHSITLSYPLKPTYQQKRIYSDFFNLLANVLPCFKCKQNYKKHIAENPISHNLDSKKDFIKWLINIHNKTNKINDKKEISYQEFETIYSDLYKNKEESITYYKDKNITQKTIISILLGIITLLVFFIAFKYYI